MPSVKMNKTIVAAVTASFVVVFVTFAYRGKLKFRIFAEEPPKIILWYFPPRYLPKDINDLVPLSACPHLNCVMTRNWTYLSQSDAVIFSAEHIKGDVLPPRKPDQVWIFHNNEPPYLFAHGRAFHKPPWSSAFNWTMDFRHDADIVRPYAVLRNKTKTEHKNYTDIVKRKTKFVAIMISNCNNWSGRLQYANALSTFVPVDIYGSCGKYKAFPRDKNKEWLQYLSSNYKFYLAFENLYCMDYISEKFFNNFNLDLVSVARGGGNYSRDVPQGTYINVADFKTPKELAEYMLFLNKTDDKYIDILKKKDQYFFETDEYYYIDSSGPYIEHYYEKQPLCQLCKKLKNIEMHSKSIGNIVPWFQKGVCIKRDFQSRNR